MKLVIQRVRSASVEVGGRTVGRIGHGLLVLVGVTHRDTVEDAKWLATKTVAMRIFNDPRGVMNLSVKDIEGSVLAVSQFTLYGSARKGNRPSYIEAARPEVAAPLYDRYCLEVQELLGKPVEKGIFGADMQVELVNDGPVTIILEK